MTPASDPRRREPPARVRLAFAVWQFVRVMVQLEKVGPRSAAWRAWRSDWQRLDRRLARLGRSDRAAFSRAMMDEEVVIEDATPAEVADVVRALDAIIRQMNTALQKEATEEGSIADLEFERGELIALRDEIRSRSPRNRPRRPRR